MDFCTLGMLIIDEIRHPPPKPPSYDVLGGAGTFAALGARLFRPPPTSANIAWTIHRGYDFPIDVQQEIESWRTGVQWIETPERQTTRALNEYIGDKGDDFRAFRYTSVKVRIEETHLTDDMISSKSFHMVCSPERCIKLIKGIQLRRKELPCISDTLYVWEPVPDLCDPSAFEAIKDVAQYVDVISPNLAELSALFSSDETVDEQTRRMEERCLALLEGYPAEKNGAVIVRCGSEGCYVKSRTESQMLPAYWTGSESKTKVIDPTGGGNQFLGGLCIGMQSEDPPNFSRHIRGSIYGNIAASFAVEQVGVPSLSRQGDDELWNNDSANTRMQNYLKRIQKHEI